MARRGQTFEIEASDAVLRELEGYITAAPAKARKMALRVLRRELKRGKSQASKVIREFINLKKRPVDERISARVVSQGALVGSLAVRDRKVELVEFLTQNQITRNIVRQRGRRSRVKGVRVKPYRKKPSRVIEGTFIAIGTRSGRPHVLKRRGRERYPIRIQYGPNLATGFNREIGNLAEQAAGRMNAELLRLFRTNVDIT